MKQFFKNLGLNDKEINCYLKMLELGAQPASVIAKYSSVPRSSVYIFLDELKKNGFVEEFERASIKHYRAISAGEIAMLLKAKEKQLEQTQDLYMEALPDLERLENRLSITPQVKFFEGRNNLAKVYEEVLKEEEFYAYFNPALVKQYMPQYHETIPETLKSNGGKAKELLVDCQEAQQYQQNFQSQKHQIKILPKKLKFQSDTIICRDKIYMISYGEDQVSAIEIFNSSLATTQRQIFEQLWGKF